MADLNIMDESVERPKAAPTAQLDFDVRRGGMEGSGEKADAP